MNPSKARALAAVAAVATICSALIGAGGSAQATPAPNGHNAVPLHGIPVLEAGVGTGGPTDAQCRKAIHQPCYSPQEIRRAYGLTDLIKSGSDGAGQTIVIIDSFGSPTAKSDLDAFDKAYGLPAPPSFTVLHPLGTVPFNPNDGTQLGWAEETSLDVQWSHALAPAANIVVMTSPVAETEGVQGLPDFLKLEQYAVSHHIGNIISQSWAATENTLFTKAGKELMGQFNSFYRTAGQHGVTFLTGAGDSGTANPNVPGATYPFPTVNFPAISPYVTAVGGTSLYATTTGKYQKETVWNDGPDDATGGGVSQYFPEPAYQSSLPAHDQKLLDGHRAIPDVAFNADPNTGVPVALGFLSSSVVFGIFGGTSEGSPAWAGVVADLDQLAGRPLGFLNPGIYALGAQHLLAPALAHDVTVGNNAQGPIAGYSAGWGWDAATGWGTPNLKNAPQLISAVKNSH